AWPNGISTGNLISSAIWALPALAAWMHLHLKLDRRHSELLAAFAAIGFGVEHILGDPAAGPPRRKISRSTLEFRAVLVPVDDNRRAAAGVSHKSRHRRRVGRHATKGRRKMLRRSKVRSPHTGERTRHQATAR